MPTGFWSSFSPCCVHWWPLSWGKYAAKDYLFYWPQPVLIESTSLWQGKLHVTIRTCAIFWIENTYFYPTWSVLTVFFPAETRWDIISMKLPFGIGMCFFKYSVDLNFALRSLICGIKTLCVCRQEKQNTARYTLVNFLIPPLSNPQSPT